MGHVNGTYETPARDWNLIVNELSQKYSLRYMRMYHPSRHMVINTCAERTYNKVRRELF